MSHSEGVKWRLCVCRSLVLLRFSCCDVIVFTWTPVQGVFVSGGVSSLGHVEETSWFVSDVVALQSWGQRSSELTQHFFCINVIIMTKFTKLSTKMMSVSLSYPKGKFYCSNSSDPLVSVSSVGPHKLFSIDIKWDAMNMIPEKHWRRPVTAWCHLVLGFLGPCALAAQWTTNHNPSWPLNQSQNSVL